VGTKARGELVNPQALDLAKRMEDDRQKLFLRRYKRKKRLSVDKDKGEQQDTDARRTAKGN